MNKLTSAFMGLMLMLTFTVGAFAKDCCDGDHACCKGTSCCAKKHSTLKK